MGWKTFFKFVCFLSFLSSFICVTFRPTRLPSFKPSKIPTISPSPRPTFSPTTAVPSIYPSPSPTKFPTISPSKHPSLSPTLRPTRIPSILPTPLPTLSPSYRPSKVPSISPSVYPSLNPTFGPSKPPTISPSIHPSLFPSFPPSIFPTRAPTFVPTKFPSHLPTKQPTLSPSETPTMVPSSSPSTRPTSRPSAKPTAKPSSIPTTYPSSLPTSSPSSHSNFNTVTIYISIVLDNLTLQTISSASIQTLKQYLESSLTKVIDFKTLDASYTVLTSSNLTRRRLSSISQAIVHFKVITNIAELQNIFNSKSINVDFYINKIIYLLALNHSYVYLLQLNGYLSISSIKDLFDLLNQITISELPMVSTNDPINHKSDSIIWMHKSILIGIIIGGCIVLFFFINYIRYCYFYSLCCFGEWCVPKELSPRVINNLMLINTDEPIPLSIVSYPDQYIKEGSAPPLDIDQNYADGISETQYPVAFAIIPQNL